MKLWKISLLCLVLAAVATPAAALGPLDAHADVTLSSKYVWRGITAVSDYVVQPEIGASFAGFGFNVWGNINTKDLVIDDEIAQSSWEFNELDYTLSYDLSLPLVSFGVGLIYYDYPNFKDDRTTEFYVTASASVLLSPTLTIYQDVDKYKGAYWEASVSHGVPLSPAWNLELAGGLGLGSKGYFQGYFGVIPDLDVPDEFSDFTGASMSDYYLSASVPFSSVPFLTITPSVTYAALLGDAKDSAKGFGEDENAFFWGISASFSF